MLSRDNGVDGMSMEHPLPVSTKSRLRSRSRSIKFILFLIDRRNAALGDKAKMRCSTARMAETMADLSSSQMEFPDTRGFQWSSAEIA
jgi:hypothetical protein